MSRRHARTTRVALSMLAPNFFGFLLFTAGPILFSLVMAFTNWDLTRHNALSQEHIRFIGVDNFVNLFVGYNQRYFVQYFNNTIYLLIGIPIGILLSLIGALLLNDQLPLVKTARRRGHFVLLTLGLTVFVSVLESALGVAPLGIFFTAVTGALVLLGQLFGQTSFRTIYYLPNLTAGVAYYLLWKALFQPDNGPINRMLQPGLTTLTVVVHTTPAWLWQGVGGLLIFAAAVGMLWALGTGILRVKYGDAGLLATVLTLLGFFALAIALYGIGMTILHLPAAVAQAPLRAPEWLSSMEWSKPAIIIMGIFTAMGSNNMLLYLAALSNVPVELTEAATIDGATKWQNFWYITWPQLAPTTFFIVVMSLIGGLQGGFEQARVMTNGGPAGSTTTLSYYLYQKGFVDFQLGAASAIAWVIFLLIFVVTLINWKFGNKMVND